MYNIVVVDEISYFNGDVLVGNVNVFILDFFEIIDKGIVLVGSIDIVYVGV